MSDEILASVKNLCFGYDKKLIIENLSFEILSEENLTLIGPSGCGKSTLLLLLGNHLLPKEGRIEFDKKIILSGNQRNVATVFQEDLLFPNLNVYNNISFGLELRNESPQVIKKRINELAELLEVESLLEREINQLSGGQRQRIAIARTLAINPRLILLDEPFSALDFLLRIKLIRKLKEYKKNNASTFVYVTHNLEEAFAFSDRIAIMSKGGVIEQIDKSEMIYGSPKNNEIARFIGIENVLSRDVFLEISKISELSFSQGINVTFIAFHAKDVMFSNEGVKATIIDIEFRGAFYFIALMTESNVSITAQLTRLDEEIQIGREVTVSVAANKLILID